MKKAIFTLLIAGFVSVSGVFAGGAEEAIAPEETYHMSVLMSMAINPDIQQSDENMIGQYIKDEFNIVFDYTPIVGDWMEKVNLVLATGDYTDIVGMNDVSTMRKFIDAGVSLDLEEYFDIAPNFEEVFARQIPLWRNYSDTGKVYHWERSVGGAGGVMGTPFIPGDIAVRTDALEAQGWPDISSESALVAFLKQALVDFPETNGLPTVGLSAPFGEPWGLQGIGPIAYEKGEKYTAAAGNNAVIWSVAENKFVDYFLNEYVYESFRFFNTLHREGLLDLEVFTDLWPQTVDKTKSGQAIALWYATWAAGEANQGFVAAGNPEMQYISVPFQTDTQYQNGEARLRTVALTNFSDAYTLTKNTQYPERFMELMNFTLTDEGQMMLNGGFEGTTFTMVDGKRQITDEYFENWSNWEWKKRVGLAWEFRYLPHYSGIGTDGIQYDLWTPELGLRLLTDRTREAYAGMNLDYWYDRNKFETIDIGGEVLDPRSDAGRLEAKLIDFRNRTAVELIQADSAAEFESIYRSAVDEYKALNPEIVADEFNRQYQAKKQ